MINKIFKSCSSKIYKFFSEVPSKKIKESKNKPFQQITSEHWQKLLSNVDPIVKQIVKSLNSKEVKEILIQMQKKSVLVTKDLKKYLQFDKYGIHSYRNFQSLSILLLALQKTKINTLNQYRQKILDFLIVFQEQDGMEFKKILNQLDIQIIWLVIQTSFDNLQMMQENNTKKKLKLNLLNLINLQIHRIVVKPKYMKILLKIIIKMYDKNSSIDKLRFIKVIDAIELKIYNTLNQYNMSGKKYNQYSGQFFQTIINKSFIVSYFGIINQFSFKEKQLVRIILNIIISPQYCPLNEFGIFFLLKCYHLCPSILITKNNSKQLMDAKNILVQWLENSLNNAQFKKLFQSYDKIMIATFFKYFLQSKLFQCFFSQKFTIINYQTIIKKQQFIQPKLTDLHCSIFQYCVNQLKNNKTCWQIIKILNSSLIKKYQANTKIQINKDNYQLSTNKDNNILKSDFQGQFFKKSIAYENQISCKIMYGLESLGISYQNDISIIGKLASFYIKQQNLIIQFDEDIQVDTRTSNLNPQTSIRNMSFLTAGYKLIIISLYQYNCNRNLKQLSNVIKQKLQIMKKYNAIYVY